MELQWPSEKAKLAEIPVGTLIYLTGTIYSARDMAHKRLLEYIAEGKALPFDLHNNLIYYMGPSPAKADEVIGSCGPTTATRMDFATPTLLDLGLSGMIGKGYRSPAVIDSLAKNQAYYFVTIGGAGAYLSECIKSAEIIAFEDLKAESIMRLEVERFPIILAINPKKDNIYE